MKRSSTPCAPKSGEHEEKIAPSDAAASIVSIASIEFGSHTATRSPDSIPRRSRADARFATRWRSSSHDRVRRLPVSSIATRASPSPVRCKKFSTMLSLASGKNRVEMNSTAGSLGLAVLVTTRSPRSPTMPQNCQIELQNSSGDFTDH